MLCDTGRHDKGSYCRLLDIDGIRYVLRLDVNKNDSDCMENGLIQAVYEASCPLDRSLVSEAMENCMTRFWPYIVTDYETGKKHGTLPKPIGPLDYDRWESRKLQLKTVDGSVRVIEHETALDNRCEAVDNPFIGEVLCFHRSEVEIIDEITNSIFEVKIQNNYYCLKLLRWERGFLEEIKKTAQSTSSEYCQVGRVGGASERQSYWLLMPFIRGGALGTQVAATNLRRRCGRNVSPIQ